MDRIKGQLNIKLSIATIAQIKALAARRGESQANVITIAIDRMAMEELTPATPEKDSES